MRVRCVNAPSHKDQKKSIDYSGETWVTGKAESISLGVVAPLGETMLESNIGWIRRKVLFQKVNRSDGTMAPAWKDLGLIPRVAIALTVGSSLGCIALPCHDCVIPLRRGEGEHNLPTLKNSEADLFIIGRIAIHSEVKEAWFAMTQTNLLH